MTCPHHEVKIIYRRIKIQVLELVIQYERSHSFEEYAISKCACCPYLLFVKVVKSDVVILFFTIKPMVLTLASTRYKVWFTFRSTKIEIFWAGQRSFFGLARFFSTYYFSITNPPNSSAKVIVELLEQSTFGKWRGVLKGSFAKKNHSVILKKIIKVMFS